MDKPLAIDYYTDMLCVWAWIAQRRTEELETTWGDKIDLRYRYVNVFGDTQSRIGNGWAKRGGYEGFRDHVVESAEPYENAAVSPDVWSKVRPKSSANSHLVLSAAGIIESREAATDLAAKIRHAFFVDARDIGDLAVLFEIVTEGDLDADRIRASISDGDAAAALMHDYQSAAAGNIAGSPSWVLNEGRQKLYGNVGYHVLNANVEGLFAGHTTDASWC
jgi:predicted DsbA family dithiol-disulfide isomerase